MIPKEGACMAVLRRKRMLLYNELFRGYGLKGMKIA